MSDKTFVTYGYAYYDPKNGGLLVNTVATTPTEAEVNLSVMEIQDERMERLIMVEVELYYDAQEEE